MDYSSLAYICVCELRRMRFILSSQFTIFDWVFSAFPNSQAERGMTDTPVGYARINEERPLLDTLEFS